MGELSSQERCSRRKSGLRELESPPEPSGKAKVSDMQHTLSELTYNEQSSAIDVQQRNLRDKTKKIYMQILSLDRLCIIA